MDWRKQLETLRTQFEAGSSRSPNLCHSLYAIDGRRREVLNDVTEESRRKNAWFANGRDVLVKMPHGYPYLITSHQMYVEEPYQELGDRGVTEFNRLALSASKIILYLPHRVLQLLEPPESPDPDAGIANALWLSYQWVQLRRDRQLQAKARLEAAGKDSSRIIVPDADKIVWRSPSSCDETTWALLLHNLGWKVDDTHPLHAKRWTWNGPFSYSVLGSDKWKGILTGRFGTECKRSVPLPLEWVQSELPANPFLCSVWAIDMLLDAAADDGTVTTNTVASGDDDFTLRVTDVSKMTGLNTGAVSRLCSDGTLITNGKTGYERRISATSAYTLQQRMLTERKVAVLPVNRP